MEDLNPYSAPRVAGQPVIVGDRQRNWLRGLTCLMMFTITIGTYYSFVDIESILVSGGILFVVGVFVAFLGERTQQYMAVWLGLSGPGMSVLVFLLIFLNDWSPQRAERPVPILATAYGLSFVALAFYFLLRDNPEPDSGAFIDDLPAEA